MTRKQLLLGGLFGLVLLCGGRSLWLANRTVPVEVAHAARLAPLPAGAPAVEPSAWLASFFPPPASTATGCDTCHAEAATAWAASPHAAAVSCADCHVRGEEVFGPGRRASSDPVPPEQATPSGGHGPSIAQADLRSPTFCAPCHDAAGEPSGGEGKPLSEITAEWQRTPAAQRGESCQSCHMPGGAHSFRGTNDLAFLQGAFTARAKFISDGQQMVGKLTVTATDAVGHRLPSGTGQELRLSIVQLDHARLILEGSDREGVVGRRLDPTGATELFDTRLLPGETHEMPYIHTLEADCAVVRARVELVKGDSAVVVWEDQVLIPG